ncbi:GNAT family N-acetyltransferase [Heliobacterium undosum]|uniref:GNAT family N-acetyltransferase n=1 Tax=Heliomicrobium undosum TaxID=121734 RepID=A0A845L124_9FIRM|nr:GNAT family N-acetyltransferase [Heliomicrobium undosum]MZP28645.1 GNAT family N-acetyltransferase [Heliomicrobium undosum]
MVSIQTASVSDLDSLADLYEELASKTTNVVKMREQFRWMDSNPDYVVLVAKEGETVIGSAMGVVCHDLVGDCDPFMVVENVIVRSAFRGKGIGRRLMEKIEEIAAANSCQYIMFVSRTDRKGAHRFYQSIGYSLDVVQGFKKFL